MHVVIQSVRFGLFAIVAASAFAQSWQQKAPPSSPSARNSSPAAFDVYRGVIVLFGGYDGTATPLSDTLEWNGVTWTPRVTLVRPPARWGHGMVYDTRRGRAVLFGGYRQGVGMVADTWEWDGNTWQQRVAPVAPPARGYFGMAYDGARGVTVVYGGLANGTQFLGDCWEWDGNAWGQRVTATSPSARKGVAMAWDETRREVLLFGGSDGTQLFGDTWTYNGTNWLQRTTATSPPARHEGYAAHDGNCGRMVLYGGADLAFATNYPDAWEWDGGSWVSISGATPPARHGASMAFDAQRGQLVVWGGRSSTGFFADTWELGSPCSRTMSVLSPPVVGQMAQFRYDYPPAAGNQHFCWTLITPRQLGAYAVPIPGFPSFGMARVDIFNILGDSAGLLDASGGLVTPVAIPNTPTVIGFQFDVQSVDLDLNTFALRWAESDVEATVGPWLNPTLNMVAIAPGTFQMGSVAVGSPSTPVHAVTISSTFWIGQDEVTQAQYQAVMGSNPSYFQGPLPELRPVDSVSWHAAVAYCDALTVQEAAAGRLPAGYEYRLPTEAEWEYCCRAGTTTEWNVGSSLTCSQANFYCAGPYQPRFVGSYSASAFGLHDMHGNVWEWCLDSWDGSPNYPAGPVTDPYVPSAGGPSRVFRGGSWNNASSDCRSANRNYVIPSLLSSNFGFRVVCAPILP